MEVDLLSARIHLVVIYVPKLVKRFLNLRVLATKAVCLLFAALAWVIACCAGWSE
jgi:hypothetical protein